jgi:hypothetical protein
MEPICETLRSGALAGWAQQAVERQRSDLRHGGGGPGGTGPSQSHEPAGGARGACQGVRGHADGGSEWQVALLAQSDNLSIDWIPPHYVSVGSLAELSNRLTISVEKVPQ